MYFLLSPAKSLNETDPVPIELEQHYSQPPLIQSSCELMHLLKDKEPTDLMELMKVSDKIAQLNVQRNQEWLWNEDQPFTDDKAKPAVYLFNGGVYNGLDVYNMDKKQVIYLNDHLNILSGLYGLLNPLDLILPYRLEMGTQLANAKGDNLYQFWQDSITNQLLQNINQQQSSKNYKQKTIINLASNEYFKAVIAKK